jgi:anti-sigma factor RsiW
MHNCKLTRKNLIDLVLDELPGTTSAQLLADLDECESCELEYAALRSTLHVSNQALRSALPAEEFWAGYRSRLRSKLLTSESEQIAHAVKVALSSQLWLALRTIFTASVRVPVPAALGLMLLFGASFFMLRARTQANAGPAAPAVLVETRNIEVPVIQEKVVTRVVYVARKGDRSRTNRADERDVPTIAPGSDASDKTALSLVGFKPTEEVKLTVIKGSYKDEKR